MKPIVPVDIALLKRVLARMTPRPYRWWTSNSFRRLSSDPSGKDGDVAYGCVQPSDGHPDISIREEDMEGIALLCNQGDAMVAEIEHLRNELRKFMGACGCANGETLSGALGNIKQILRDGDGLQNPMEGIPDAAERVVRRAERAEAEVARLQKLVEAQHAYCNAAVMAAEVAAGDGTPKQRATANAAASAALQVVLDAGGDPP